MSDSDVVIRVEGLGKKYSLHHEQGERYTALRDVVARQAKAAGRLLNPFTLAGQLRKAQREAAAERARGEEDFWALKDVNFEIRRGERVGIIGRNGAGKSTLLKILSRITEPTTGRVEIRGRVASLLEVGTGFHPELTGRENIYLNGAILGMTRREIRSKFDEIVDFSEVEKFLDTPVKRYSSGMYVRLAFAVAAHLEPDNLIIDEVLAVGDEKFQRKCLGKIEDSSKREGITAIIVSHNMDSIARLCENCIYLENGLSLYKNTQEAVNLYRSNRKNGTACSHLTIGPLTISSLHVQATNLQSEGCFNLIFRCRANCTDEFSGDVEMVIRDQNLNPVVFLCRHLDSSRDPCWAPGERELTFTARLNGLISGGKYSVDILLVETGVRVIDEALGAFDFEVVGPMLGASINSRLHSIHGRGSVAASLYE